MEFLKYKLLPLETRRIRLREIYDEDLITMFQWRNTEKFRFLFHHDENIMSYTQFCEEFAQDKAAYRFQFLVEKKDTGELVGLTFVHTYSEHYHSCFLNIFIAENFERKGFGTDVFVQFTLFLFQQIGLKKLFVQASDYNHHSLACIRNMGIRELIGNITRRMHAGKEHNILCFAAGPELIVKLTRINEYLSRPDAKMFLKKLVKISGDSLSTP